MKAPVRAETTNK